jgi:hypothetical protein
MNDTLLEFDYELEWRLNEVKTTRLLSHKIGLSKKEIELLEKYTIVVMYAIYEGFTISLLNIYINYINSHISNVKDLKISILIHQIKKGLGINFGYDKIDDNRLLKICNCLEDKKISTLNSNNITNISSTELNRLLESYCLSTFDNRKLQSEIDYILYLRNNITHGEKDFDFKKGNIDRIINSTINILYDIMNIFVKAIIDGSTTFLRDEKN